MNKILGRQPVLIVNTVIGALGIASAYGLDVKAEVLAFVYTFVSLLANTVIVRPAVTPMIDPRDNKGNRLIPLSSRTSDPDIN